MAWSAPWVTVEVGYGSTWQTEPGDITWTDETAKVLVRNRVQCTRGASAARGKVDTGTAKFSLLNTDRRFDPTHTTGDLFGQLLPGTPVRLLAWPADQLLMVNGQIVLVDGLPVTTGSSIELWSGTVPSWPQRYDKSNKFAWCPISAFDRFDKLSRSKIPRSVLEAEIMADSPHCYWPLKETTGRVIVDRSGNGFDGVADHGTTGLSETIESIDGAELTGIGFDSEHRVFVEDARSTIDTPPLVIEAVVFADASVVGPILFRSGTGNPNGGATWQLASGGSFAAGVREVTGGVAFATVPELAQEAHHVAYRCPAGGGASILVDGVDVTDSTGTYSEGIVATPGTILGGAKTSVDLHWAGFLSDVAVYSTDIGVSRIAAHALAAMAPLDGQTTDQRAAWILDEIGWPAGFRNLSTGRSILGPATFRPGDGALQYLRLIEDTEDGLLFIGPDGSLTFHDRYWRYLETAATVSQFTFTDQDGDQGYADFQLDLDDELLVNVARFSRRGGIEQVATDTTSIGAYGEAEEQRTNLLSTTDAQVRSLAEWAVATKSLPLPRVPAIRVPLHRYSAADQATVLGLDLGHRVTVNRTPQGVGAQIDLDFQVEGVSHDIGFNEWWVTLFVSPVPQDTVELFLLGSSPLGGIHVLAH